MKKKIYIAEFKESKRSRKSYKWEIFAENLEQAIIYFMNHIHNEYENVIINYIQIATKEEKELIEKGECY